MTTKKHIKYYAKAKRMLKQYYAEIKNKTKSALQAAKRDGNVELVSRYTDSLETIKKAEQQWYDRLEAADRAEKIMDIEISVDWTKSRTWGFCPKARVWVSTKPTDTSDKRDDNNAGTGTVGYGYIETSKISGCGYDKRSTAVSRAFTALNDAILHKNTSYYVPGVFDRFVIEHGPALWNEYCVDQTPFPHLEFAGKGMGTFTAIFQVIGRKLYLEPVVKDYVIDYSEKSDASDYYHIFHKSKIIIKNNKATKGK